MRLRTIMRVFMMMALFATTGWAQDEVMSLTLDQSVAIALDKNPALKIAEKELSKVQAAVWEAYSTLMPTVDASVNFQKAWNIQENTIPNFIKVMLGPDFPGVSAMPDFVQLSFGLENTFTYGATLTQPIFLGGAGIAGVQMANAAKRASLNQLESQKQTLIYQTTNAFYGCILARELVSVQEEALKQAEANLDVVQKKYAVGSASGFDKMRAQVEAANLRPEVIAARNNYESALTGLRMVLGLEKNRQIVVEGELSFAPDAMDNLTLPEVQNLAIENRPEFFALDAQKTIAAKGVMLARSQFLPKLFFMTDYSFLAMRNDYRFKQDDFSKGFTSALSLQIPLFHGFKNTKQYQKARLDYKIVLDSDKQIRDGITAEVEIAYNKFRESKEKFKSAEESIDLAKEALRLANLTYEEGASTQLDVLNSQLALTRARLNYASALYEYQMARYEIRRVTGTLTGVL